MNDEVLILLLVVLGPGIAGFFIGGAGPLGGIATTLGGLFGVNLSPSQIAQYAANAGFTDNDLATAVAIALAESVPPGNPRSHGDTNLGSGTGSFGLWQIYSDAHPEYGPDFTKLYDPQTNANAAFAIYTQAGGFTPWTTYKSGKYEAYLPQASDAAGGISA